MTKTTDDTITIHSDGRIELSKSFMVRADEAARADLLEGRKATHVDLEVRIEGELILFQFADPLRWRRPMLREVALKRRKSGVAEVDASSVFDKYGLDPEALAREYKPRKVPGIYYTYSQATRFAIDLRRRDLCRSLLHRSA